MIREQPMLFGGTWVQVRDGDPTGLALFQRHYSRYEYADGRDPARFVGPGARIVLLTPDARALFVWREFDSQDPTAKPGDINCSIFRNEGAGLSSELIRQADELAWDRWPGRRHYTYVNPAKVRSTNPGFCFLRAGWRRAGVTKRRNLLILERLP